MKKKEQIMLAAMNLLIQNGVQGAPMSAIARKSCTGMGTIYNLFETKEGLINAIFEFIQNDLMENTGTFYKDLSVKDQFKCLYAAIVKYLVAHPLYFTFLDQFHNSPILFKQNRQQESLMMQPFIQLLAVGQKNGTVKMVEINELIPFLKGGLISFVRWILSEDIQLNDKLVSTHLFLAWEILRKELK
ncbi:TetR family transcriptional regulator [Dyadobacter frigoris]|uniref:TetR/AcrR family transcriptional regulator n=1 Tax=Dyadobacter frigoris TaxID=2576211 RepID=UPI0024A54539|nr:TetR/AcrR family transcriptional regulator [Dyadobacter frigoris]GLU55236.1 TetR family transcriptional regulator [Dyadobacter frigoris]